MSDTLPTVWNAEQHTLAKHRILLAYLNAWMPILSNHPKNVGASQQTVRYIDGFAGSGIYEKGEKGSPILALEAALNHGKDFKVPVRLIFIEADKDRCKVLEGEVARYASQIAQSLKVRVDKPQCGDCRDVIGRLLDECDQRRESFGPALVFLDQFGYSSVPMGLIRRILAHSQCEVLTYMFWRDLNRFITDPTKHSGITSAFGCTDWQDAIALPSSGRERFMLDAYSKSLKERANAKYVWPFAMLDGSENLLYWLFFCTNHLRGLEEMKRAMWKVDQTGGFTFSDREGFDQLKFLTNYTDTRLENDLERELAGRKLTVLGVKEWVLTQTPAHLFKRPLAKLESRGIARTIKSPTGRRPGTYPDKHLDNITLEFDVKMFK